MEGVIEHPDAKRGRMDALKAAARPAPRALHISIAGLLGHLAHATYIYPQPVRCLPAAAGNLKGVSTQKHFHLPASILR